MVTQWHPHIEPEKDSCNLMVRLFMVLWTLANSGKEASRNRWMQIRSRLRALRRKTIKDIRRTQQTKSQSCPSRTIGFAVYLCSKWMMSSCCMTWCFTAGEDGHWVFRDAQHCMVTTRGVKARLLTLDQIAEKYMYWQYSSWWNKSQYMFKEHRLWSFSFAKMKKMPNKTSIIIQELSICLSTVYRQTLIKTLNKRSLETLHMILSPVLFAFLSY